MAQQLLNLGAVVDDGTGDDLRTGGDKINDNFTELYAGLALLDTWTWSTNVTEVIFSTGLSGLSRVALLVRGVTLAASGTRNIQVSSDGGSTWRSTSGDYVSMGPGGTESNATSIPIHTTGTTSARGGVLTIEGWNLAAPKFTLIPPSSSNYLITHAVPLDAIRLFGSAGGNLTAGSAWLYGR